MKDNEGKAFLGGHLWKKEDDGKMKLKCFLKDKMDSHECPKCRYYEDCIKIVEKKRGSKKVRLE